jgi:hypothetical protein
MITRRNPTIKASSARTLRDFILLLYINKKNYNKVCRVTAWVRNHPANSKSSG